MTFAPPFISNLIQNLIPLAFSNSKKSNRNIKNKTAQATITAQSPVSKPKTNINELHGEKSPLKRAEKIPRTASRAWNNGRGVAREILIGFQKASRKNSSREPLRPRI